MTTGFGDVFLLEEGKGVSFLDTQRGEVEFIGSDVEWFVAELLANPGIIEGVLRKARFDELVAAKGPLTYHSAFMLEPWRMLGGEDKVENYSVCACGAYLDLVGQSLQRR